MEAFLSPANFDWDLGCSSAKLILWTEAVRLNGACNYLRADLGGYLFSEICLI